MKSVIFLHLWNKAGLQNAIQGFSLPPWRAPGSIIRFGRELTCWLQEPSELHCVSPWCCIHTATTFLFPWGGRAAVAWQTKTTAGVLSISFWLLLHPRGALAAVWRGVGGGARSERKAHRLPFRLWLLADLVCLMTHVKSCSQEARMRSGLRGYREHHPQKHAAVLQRKNQCLFTQLDE